MNLAIAGQNPVEAHRLELAGEFDPALRCNQERAESGPPFERGPAAAENRNAL